MNVAKPAALIAICGFILSGCSGDGIATEAYDLDPRENLAIAQEAYEEYLQLNSNRPIQKARPTCPTVSSVNLKTVSPKATFEHLFVAECLENGVLYSAVMIDRIKDRSSLDGQTTQDHEFNIIALTNGTNGERARAHVQNGDSGACPPVNGGNPGTEVTQIYGSCRPISGIEVTALP